MKPFAHISTFLRPAFMAGIALCRAQQVAANDGNLAYAVPERQIAAPEARQGVASDGIYIYAVDNSTIGKYEIASGKLVGKFDGDPAEFPHLNSCTVAQGELVCASSNYPAVPHRDTAEFFDPKNMRHLRSAQVAADLGSLTVLDHHDGKWWAVFANYDGKGAAEGRDHRDTMFALLRDDFTIEASWSLPDSVLTRLTPSSISGASWNADGVLYASGHDKPEVYVLALPESGKVLRHIGTIAMPSFGQAVDFDPLDGRLLWSIDRRSHTVFASRMPKPHEGGK